MWIWKQANWPNFTWDAKIISPLLRQVQLNQGILLGKMQTQDNHDSSIELNTLLANILHSSAIEGEQLNAFSVRSSLANKLGVSEQQDYPTSKQSDGVAEIMVDVIHNLSTPLTTERIFQWHCWLFPDGATHFTHFNVGDLRGSLPMQMVSGRLDRPTVHFEAPPRDILESELALFIEWFNRSKDDPLLDPLLRAAICHLWFVTLHPLDDGNGRITRALTDLALAQGEPLAIRFYAMSVSILKNRKDYYEVLEQSQKGTLDITVWVTWFLNTLDNAFFIALDDIEQVILKSRFWKTHNAVNLNDAQRKVLNRLLDGDFLLGISANQYQKVTKVSRATATRHLAFLVDVSCLKKTSGGGRNTRYIINAFV